MIVTHLPSSTNCGKHTKTRWNSPWIIVMEDRCSLIVARTASSAGVKVWTSNVSITQYYQTVRGRDVVVQVLEILYRRKMWGRDNRLVIRGSIPIKTDLRAECEEMLVEQITRLASKVVEGTTGKQFIDLLVKKWSWVAIKAKLARSFSNLFRWRGNHD